MKACVSEVPKYRQVVEQIRGDIAAGVLQQGDRVPSQNEMKLQFGISRTTVDRVHSLLEQEGLVSRERGRGTFVTSQDEAASFLRKGIIGLCGIGFMFAQPSSYWARLLDGVHEALKETHLQLLLVDSESAAARDKVDGALFNTAWADPPADYDGNQWPAVAILIPSRTVEISSVVPDDYDGMRQATQHLIDLGHRRIGYLHSTGNKFMTPRRLAGYRDALVAAGITPAKKWQRVLDDLPSVDFRKTGYTSMQHWLGDDWFELGCTALLSHNDEAAVGAIEAVSNAGLSVPEQVSVVGFDGTEISEYSRPSLTTVEVPLRQIGKLATELLLERLAGDAQDCRHVTLPTTLRVRESTARPPQARKTN